MQLYRQETEGGNCRPANDIADYNSQEAKNDPGGRLFFECGEIGLVFKGGTNKTGCRNFLDTLLDHLVALQ